MFSDDESFNVFVIFLVVIFGVFGGMILLNFLTTPQTGDIAGHSVTMPGIAWIGLPAFAIIVLILYVKNRM
ncbi:hypothetical protein [Methanolobus bombayensis]|uniref:hypothetical protein n=1 Tax=Methanolobus bombayensis TaxID=38023 RepID=UPI001AEA8FDD|nr:hypothetical protein [Methanolobus bombayensis]MBP1908446.1 hypothetical protein [Methanolobus bombayensis]